MDIPWARIKIDSLPDTAEPVSEDEVILNGPHKSKEELIKREFAAKRNQEWIFALIYASILVKTSALMPMA